MALLKHLNDKGITIVMVTHNPENQQFFHRTVVLRDGRVHFELPACEVGTPLYRPARV